MKIIEPDIEDSTDYSYPCVNHATQAHGLQDTTVLASRDAENVGNHTPEAVSLVALDDGEVQAHIPEAAFPTSQNVEEGRYHTHDGRPQVFESFDDYHEYSYPDDPVLAPIPLVRQQQEDYFANDEDYSILESNFDDSKTNDANDRRPFYFTFNKSDGSLEGNVDDRKLTSDAQSNGDSNVNEMNSMNVQGDRSIKTDITIPIPQVPNQLSHQLPSHAGTLTDTRPQSDYTPYRPPDKENEYMRLRCQEPDTTYLVPYTDQVNTPARGLVRALDDAEKICDHDLEGHDVFVENTSDDHDYAYKVFTSDPVFRRGMCQ
ncbi:uncharacterized protein LOC117102483 [Anneissia japonica]|uniref:uncharacterized protein LOC117102483 n=1 Tax=Anneissia japonica TaxID=1529436 RepID=UPI001425B80D|nr:uncharacterized protein LOC117102483 [Anneissia japonica]